MTPTSICLDEFDAILRNDFMNFVERSFRELYPNTPFSRSPHLNVLSAKLMECFTGKCKRLIINLPPRSLKSFTVSAAYPAWVLGKRAETQIICASYGQELADKHARDTKTIMLSPFFKRAFPTTQLSLQRLAVNDFMTTKQGFRMATSVGGVLTGRGGDLLIVDDPLKPDDAFSETKRNAANEWFDNTFLSRRNSKEDGVIIIVMQRLHQDDLVGYLLSKDAGWEVISFPAIAVEDEDFMTATTFGPFRYMRKIGAVLDANRESLATLLQCKQESGTYIFESQYQQNPSPVGGSLVRTEWLRYYDCRVPLPRFTSTLQSWDTANKSGELNDFSVCTTWGVYDGKYYLLDVVRERMDYPDLKRKVLAQITKFRPNSVLIEDKASGTQLIQELKGMGITCAIKPYTAPPQTDKVMRLHAQTANFESGNVILPNEAPWLREYVRELTTFPGSKFDDQVDSTAQALDYFGKNRSLDIWTRLGRAR